MEKLKVCKNNLPVNFLREIAKFERKYGIPGTVRGLGKVLIVDGNADMGEHMRSYLGYLIY